MPRGHSFLRLQFPPQLTLFRSQNPKISLYVFTRVVVTSECLTQKFPLHLTSSLMKRKRKNRKQRAEKAIRNREKAGESPKGMKPSSRRPSLLNSKFPLAF